MKKVMFDAQMGVCEMCGEVEILLPFGPNSEKICGTCGQKDIEAVALHVAAEMEKMFGVARPVN